jgi:hypothetical protein
MSLNKALQDLKFDKRLLDLQIKQGRITKQEAEAHDKSLPDLQADCENIDLEKEETSIN